MLETPSTTSVQGSLTPWQQNQAFELRIGYGSVLCADLQNKLKRLPESRLKNLLTAPTLHHSQRELFRDACAMSEAGLSFEEQLDVLRARFEGYYRPITEREFENAVKNAMTETGRTGALRLRTKLPSINIASRLAALENSPVASLAELTQLSEIKAPGLIPTAGIIDQLFKPDELICMASNKWDAATKSRREFSGTEHRHQFIVANPMAARWGITQAGTRSQRCKQNVGEHRRLVVEFDQGTLDEQARLIGHLLNLKWPIRMVLFSGGKSLHSWIELSGLSRPQQTDLRRYAASIGADPATFTPSQLVRTPNALRLPAGTKQEVLLFRSV